MSTRERGEATVEAILLGLVLLVPVMWMLTTFAAVHRAALATQAAARDGGIGASRADGRQEAVREARVRIELALAQAGLSPRAATVEWQMPAAWQRGGRFALAVTYPVPVFDLPVLGPLTVATIDVTARHSGAIERYASR